MKKLTKNKKKVKILQEIEDFWSNVVKRGELISGDTEYLDDYLKSDNPKIKKIVSKCIKLWDELYELEAEAVELCSVELDHEYDDTEEENEKLSI